MTGIAEVAGYTPMLTPRCPQRDPIAGIQCTHGYPHKGKCRRAKGGVLEWKPKK